MYQALGKSGKEKVLEDFGTLISRRIYAMTSYTMTDLIGNIVSSQYSKHQDISPVMNIQYSH